MVRWFCFALLPSLRHVRSFTAVAPHPLLSFSRRTSHSCSFDTILYCCSLPFLFCLWFACSCVLHSHFISFRIIFILSGRCGTSQSSDRCHCDAVMAPIRVFREIGQSRQPTAATVFFFIKMKPFSVYYFDFIYFSMKWSDDKEDDGARNDRKSHAH